MSEPRKQDVERVPLSSIAPDARDLIQAYRESGEISFQDVPLATARENYLRGCGVMACRVPIAPSSAIMRCRFQARPCACEYRRDASGKPPAVLFMHGGGWVIGNLDTHDAICRTLAGKAEPRCTPSTIAWRPSIRFQHRWTIAPPRCAGWSIMPRAWTWMFRGWAWRATAPAATWPRSGEHSGSVAAGLHRAGAGAVLSRDRSAWRDGFVPTHRRRIPTDRQLDALVPRPLPASGYFLGRRAFSSLFSPLLSPLLAPRPSTLPCSC